VGAARGQVGKSRLRTNNNGGVVRKLLLNREGELGGVGDKLGLDGGEGIALPLGTEGQTRSIRQLGSVNSDVTDELDVRASNVVVGQTNQSLISGLSVVGANKLERGSVVDKLGGITSQARLGAESELTGSTEGEGLVASGERGSNGWVGLEGVGNSGREGTNRGVLVVEGGLGGVLVALVLTEQNGLQALNNLILNGDLS
jgi:hypothetical protein